MPGFHALSAAWLFALIAPLVLLYFLKGIGFEESDQCGVGIQD